jgi:hypothetical protein
MNDLTKKTYLSYALSMYTNTSCTGMHEFQEDLVRLKYIKRLIHRYIRTGEISPRLLVNHLINAYNVFQPESIARLLFFRAHPDAHSALRTVLDYVNLMPPVLPPIDGVVYTAAAIPEDTRLKELLTHAIEAPHHRPQKS